MVDIEIIHEWIAKADEDFEFARVNFMEEKPFFAQICFHFQQSGEKYLKAYIIAHELEFRRIHELTMLVNICLTEDASFEQLKEDCEYLTTFYVETRYPVHWPTHYSREETAKAFHSAQNIRSFVKKKLSLA